jgi:hypothetical protein
LLRAISIRLNPFNTRASSQTRATHLNASELGS